MFYGINFKMPNRNTPSRSGKRTKKRKSPWKYKAIANKKGARLDLDQAVNLVDQASDSEAEEEVPPSASVDDGPGPSQNLQLKSRSAKKLCLHDIPYPVYPDSEEDWTDYESDEEEDEVVNSASCRLVDLNILQSHVNESVSCRGCGADVDLVEEKRAGLGSMFRFKCRKKTCKYQKDFPSNKQIPVSKSGSISIHSINRRAVLAMRLI